jgi:hypothetical protein
MGFPKLLKEPAKVQTGICGSEKQFIKTDQGPLNFPEENSQIPEEKRRLKNRTQQVR